MDSDIEKTVSELNHFLRQKSQDNHYLELIIQLAKIYHGSDRERKLYLITGLGPVDEEIFKAILKQLFKDHCDTSTVDQIMSVIGKRLIILQGIVSSQAIGTIKSILSDDPVCGQIIRPQCDLMIIGNNPIPETENESLCRMYSFNA